MASRPVRIQFFESQFNSLLYDAWLLPAQKEVLVMKVEVCGGRTVMELLSILVLSVAFIHLINRVFPFFLTFYSSHQKQNTL
jgi:hypothetical protein